MLQAGQSGNGKSKAQSSWAKLICTHELGMDTTNLNPTHGTPLNPYNENYYTGGISGGSAYAVATELVPIAMGADGSSSIRLPSSFCGLYGLKPSHGRVSGAPTPSPAPSVSVLDPHSANMTDQDIAHRVTAAPDPSPTSSTLFPPPDSSLSPSSTPKLSIHKP